MRARLRKFDHPFREKAGLLAGVDEAGRGPLAGPVVAAAVILPADFRLPSLNDSKQLSELQRIVLYRLIQRQALAVGVGIVSHEEIDEINIRQASFVAMRRALAHLIFQPRHVLVDGFQIPNLVYAQTAVIGGDGRSASIAAASVVAKVTRDSLMHWMDRCYPNYGFAQHKGYGTPDHLEALEKQGPCAIHRRSFAPVRINSVVASLNTHDTGANVRERE